METTYIDLNHYRGAQLVDTLQNAADTLQHLQLIKMLQPKFGKDGNQYCFLYGELPNDCIVGFGDTPYLAMLDFSHNFYNSKATPNPTKEDER